MLLRAAAAALAVMVCGLAAPCLWAQEQPLARSFSSGTSESYHVELTLKSEVRGVSTEKIGVNTYVKPFIHQAEARVSWTSARRVLSVAPDGTAEISESLGDIVADCRPAAGAANSDPALQDSLGQICSQWSTSRSLRYHETPGGLIRDLPRGEIISLGEEHPLLLTLWLRRALRPSVILPAEPPHIGLRHQTRSQPVNFPWSAARGSQTIEWIGAPGAQQGITLHVVQDLSGVASARTELHAEPASSAGPPRGAQETFYADSLATLSLLDGSIISATRTATREKNETLKPVPGLPDPPRFGVKLTVTVAIRKLT